MKYYIAVAKTPDINQILQIENECFDPLDRFKYGQMWKLINNGKGSFLTYRSDDAIRGYIYFRHLSNRLAWVYSLAVDPMYQRQGIAEKLMKKAEEWGSLTHDTMQLEVKEHNHSARSFYKKLGYKEHSIKHNYYKDGSHAILMIKDLKTNAQG